MEPNIQNLFADCSIEIDDSPLAKMEREALAYRMLISQLRMNLNRMYHQTNSLDATFNDLAQLAPSTEETISAMREQLKPITEQVLKWRNELVASEQLSNALNEIQEGDS